MRHTYFHTNPKVNSAILPLLTGIGIGVGLGVFVSANKQEAKRLVQDKLEQLKDLWDESWEDSQGTVQNLFGEVSAKTQLAYLKARRHLNQQLANLTEGLSEINKEKYRAIVTTITDDMIRDKSLSSEYVSILKQFLLEDYGRLKKHFRTNA